MQIRVIDGKPSAREEKSLLDPLQVQRERKLWSFLTWAFLLAQIAIAEKLFGSSAQAAIDDEAASSDDGGTDWQAQPGGELPGVTGFMDENGLEAANKAAGEAGRFELSDKTPAGDMPEAGNQADGDSTTLMTAIPGNSGAAQVSPGGANSSPETVAAPNIPGISISNPDVSLPPVADLPEGLTDTLLGQLGIDLNLSLYLGIDIDGLGLVSNTTHTTFAALDGLLSSAASTPLLASVTTPLTGLLGARPSLGANEYSTPSGVHSDYMLALNAQDVDPSDAPVSLQPFPLDLPIIGDALHQEANGEDVSALSAIHPLSEAATSLIDDLHVSKELEMGL